LGIPDSIRSERALGDAYVEKLFSLFAGRVPAEADLVTYWFRKASGYLTRGKLRAAGLVTTNSIRGGASRRVLDEIVASKTIFDAWADEAWIIDGVAVRVSLICFRAKDGNHPLVRLDGHPVNVINADLTSSLDLITASRLHENAEVAFMGDTKGGPFDVSGIVARQWLTLPINPNGKSNAEVVRPWVNGLDVTRRPSDKWIIDFGWNLTAAAAALYESPFAYCEKNVRPERKKNRRELYKNYWWRHAEPRPGMWKALRVRPGTL
jgi:type II restriction/modification system DNA methylase subunit YeeA